MRLYFSVILLMICAGCGSNRKQVKDFQDKHENNGVSIRARFIEGGGNDAFQEEESRGVHAATDSGGRYLYFDIQLERPGFEADRKTAEYLDFEVGSDFSMKNGIDSVPASLVHRVANGRKDVYEYIVVFGKPDTHKSEKGAVSIIYDDKLFGLGRQVFEFNKQDILKATDKTN